MARTKTRRPRDLTDKELLASAWSELKGTTTAGKSTTDPHSAIQRTTAGHLREVRALDQQGGDDVRFHKDFTGVVHSGCRAPKVTVRKIEKTVVVTGGREPSVCPECHLEHAGGCW